MGFEETNEAAITRGFWVSFSEVALELAQAYKEHDELKAQEKLEKLKGLAETMPDLSKWVEEAHKAGTSLAACMLDKLSQ